ncbi:TPA: transcriptional regulator [Candidatus Uhrbacteria bacterium]|nr:transcriptional regulator [Candidatus Uhrbacteria bacterium]HCU31276.1 transcriptional regulator [Candidatus Uhrbacteria bacterium]
MDKNPAWRRELEKVLRLAAGDPKTFNLLLEDLLSPEELKVLPVRWQIIKRLNQGRPHHKITEELGVGVATVTRGSQMLKNKTGGFQQILKKLK